MAHHSEDQAINNIAKAFASISKRQKKNIKTRFKYKSRLDEYVGYTAERFGAIITKRNFKRKLEIVRNRDNKDNYIPEFEIHETTGRGGNKSSYVVERFESYELAQEHVNFILSA